MDVPLIAVTSSEMRASTVGTGKVQGDPPRDEMVLGLRYLSALEGAGCMAVVVPPMPLERIEALLDRVDGICLSGGPDLVPAAYGAVEHPLLGPTEPALDRFELALAHRADDRGMPILAICRGAQLMNIVRGGTLFQHLPDVVGTEVDHRQTESGTFPTHEVVLEPDSDLARIVGEQELRVNSFHHQAVDRLGEGLRIVGRAPDGTVEAFESTDDHFVVGVQWHAESLTALREQAALYRAFVAACRGARVASV